MKSHEFINKINYFDDGSSLSFKDESVNSRYAFVANTLTHSWLLSSEICGASNVISVKETLEEQGPKILSPQEQQVKSMSDQAKRLQQQAKQIKARSKLQKAQQQLATAKN